MSDLLTAIAERRAAAASATWPDYTDTIEQPETMVLVWDVIAAAEPAIGHWCFINAYQDIECLHCGEVHHEEVGFPHMPDCAYVGLRNALSALADHLGTREAGREA